MGAEVTEWGEGWRGADCCRGGWLGRVCRGAGVGFRVAGLKGETDDVELDVCVEV